MSIERITALLKRCGGPDKNFPPTDLYNEGWMLRLVLDWFSCNPGIDHDLAFATTDKWYSEALLPSAFLARVRGDKLAESWTHADGVIGDFAIGEMNIVVAVKTVFLNAGEKNEKAIFVYLYRYYVVKLR